MVQYITEQVSKGIKIPFIAKAKRAKGTNTIPKLNKYLTCYKDIRQLGHEF